uniref:Ig-like domain-containing protein n=1 Tax=Astatotilapia calliptera TaxID=8154 RepID=A0A3P8PHJ8_ASTCA
MTLLLCYKQQSFYIYRGETVTVRCEIQGGERAQWTYEWRAAKLNTPPTSNEYRIIRATESDSGGYSCRGKRSFSRTEWMSNRPVVTLYPNWSEIYGGETITVRCEIHGGDTEWDYEWKTNSIIKPPNLNEYRIRSASSYNSGNYRCKGRMKSSQHETTEWSDSVTLTVSDNKPCPVLTVSPSWLSPGASVTLNCEVEHPSAGWSFYWYKATHTAGYVCRAGRGDPEYHTDHSQPKPVVTLHPNWSEIYRGETITVRCEIHGGDTEWDYEWEANSIRKPPNQNEYRFRSASSSNSGNYRCKGRMKSSQHETTEWSDSVTLTVSDSKSCLLRLLFFVEHPSAGWSFYWYKAVPDLSEKSSSYELLPDGSGTAQDSYIIHGQTHTAGYVCRAGRGDPEYHTDHSQPKFVWSAGQLVSLCPFNELMLAHHFYSPRFRPLKSCFHDNHLSLYKLKLPKRRTELNIFLSLCDQTKLNFLVSF